MFANDPVAALALVHERHHRLREETASSRLCDPSRIRRVVAAALRCAAHRLEPAPLPARAA